MMTHLYNAARLVRDRMALSRLESKQVRSGVLPSPEEVPYRQAMSTADAEAEWEEVHESFEALGLPDGTGGVNRGDQRAIYSLVRALAPSSVLEIGTHVGASTVHIAHALSRGVSDRKPRLVTVDIHDVNSQASQPWLKYGSRSSPADLVKALGADAFVEFVTLDSASYMTSCDHTFDLIFLDGSHTAEAVYREVPAALDILNPGGVVMLHDYFPAGRPLWPSGTVIPGPYLAIKRFQREGGDVAALPLGALPWPTKEGTKVTSLALLVRET